MLMSESARLSTQSKGRMALPASMRAIEITAPGDPEVLCAGDRPVPEIGPDEVLIAVHAAGVNRPDVLQRLGRYAPPPGSTDIPGLEIAGTVVALGPAVQRWQIGDKVCALVSGGGYAEFCAAPEGQCLPVPDGFSSVEAAAVPETFFTVWTNVFQLGALKPGETFLVHGGSSGIGTTAIQLAKAFGARVLATAGSDEKCRACEELGADRGINYRNEDFVAVIKAEAAGVDVVLDMVGGDYVERSLAVLAPLGRHVSIAFLRGAKVTVNLDTVMRKRLTLTGSVLRPRSVGEKSAIAAELEAKVWPLLNRRTIRPVIYQTFPLERAAESHRLMESNQHIGKIVLTTGRP